MGQDRESRGFYLGNFEDKGVAKTVTLEIILNC